MLKNMQDAPQQALAFLRSQATYIERQVFEIQYPDITYPSLIPVDFSADQWAPTVTYVSTDKVGRAKKINSRARDIPKADVTREQHETEVVLAAIGYDYDIGELGLAMKLGQNLPADRAAAARRAYEEYMEEIAYEGDTGSGFQGLLNNSTVTRADVAAGAGSGTPTEWADKTPDEILLDINSGITGMWSATKTIELADTVLLPLTQYASLFTTRLGDTTMNLMQYIRTNNIYTAQTGQELTIRAMRQLAGAGQGGSDRMVIYRKDPTVLKMHVPMPFQFLAPQGPYGLTYEVPGIFRYGGLDIRRPGAVRYYDAL